MNKFVLITTAIAVIFLVSCVKGTVVGQPEEIVESIKQEDSELKSPSDDYTVIDPDKSYTIVSANNDRGWDWQEHIPMSKLIEEHRIEMEEFNQKFEPNGYQMTTDEVREMHTRLDDIRLKAKVRVVVRAVVETARCKGSTSLRRAR